MEMTHSLYIFMIALFTALIMVPFLQRWAVDTGAVDVPGGRKMHKGAVPRIGGVAICMAWLFSLLAYVDISREIRGIMAGALIMFFTGFIDDLYTLSSRRKFAGQTIACLITVMVGRIQIHNLGDLFGAGPVLLPEWLAIPFTLFALIGVVNAFNLMDGLDGLAGGISVVALTSFIILGFLSADYLVMALSAALLGGVLGFLKYNLYPARIFMGDAGSLVVGFIIACLAILLTQSAGSTVKPVVPLLILGLPIADTVRVMGRRLLLRGNPFSADRTHVHHRFLDLGLQHRFTVIIIFGFSLLLAAAVIILRQVEESLLLAGYGVTMTGFYLTIRILRANRNRFAFMRRDSSAGIRKSAAYRRLAELANHTPPAILVLTMSYFLLAALFTSQSNTATMQVGVSLFSGCLALLYITRDARNHFVTAMLAVVVILITYIQNQNDARELVPGLTLESLEGIILAALCAFLGLRFIFRDGGKPLLSSIDYLIIGIGVFLIAVSPSIVSGTEFPNTLSKGLILFLALKVTMLLGPIQARVILGSVLSVLMTIILRVLYF